MNRKRITPFAWMAMVFILINAMVLLTGVYFVFGQLPIQEVLFYSCFLDWNQLDMFRWELLACFVGSLIWVFLFKKFPKIICCLMVAWGLFLGYIYVFPLLKTRNETALFGENYILPKLKAHQKKNVILIFWESMENTFADDQIWGENLIPNMSKTEQECTTYTGYHDLKVTRSTIKSQVATLCGIPLLKKDQETFLPKAKCISDFLKEEGYYLVFMKAADTRYTHANIFAQNHSFDEIIGRQDFLKNNLITDEEKQGWGVLDSVFMRLAKAKLNELSKRTEPFLLALTTVNTHYPRGNVEKDCPVKYGDIRDNIKCSDKTLYEFVEWLQQTDFAKDTVLIVMGDHPLFINLEMSISPILYRYKNRNTFNIIMNGEKQKKHKEYVQFDWAPTILETIGFSLMPRRFGLGTSLESSEKSIIEKYGQEKLESMIEDSKEDFESRFLDEEVLLNE